MDMVVMIVQRKILHQDTLGWIRSNVRAMEDLIMEIATPQIGMVRNAYFRA
jgi:hypothetical protein